MTGVSTTLRGLAFAAALCGGWLATPTAATADNITLRIATGHPTGVVYAGLMKDYFQIELKKRVEARTPHKLAFVEGYGGSIVKVNETLAAVRDGIVDIGGYCFCFEPSNLPMHAFQVMLPFGTMDPVESLRVAQAVYKKVPYLGKVFEDRHNQILLARITDGGYNLVTKFDWNTLADLKNQKIAGAGLNLNWLSYAGITPVQSSLPDAYTSMQTNVYSGWIMFPSAVVNLKLHEPAPIYTIIGFGSITWHGLTINRDAFNKLPADVKPILMEVAADFEEQVGVVNKQRYDRDIETLRGLPNVKVKTVSPELRAEWAKSLTDWPQAKATELDGRNLPATTVLKAAIEAAEAIGYKWPVRFPIK